jgi:hypothetical protein
VPAFNRGLTAAAAVAANKCVENFGTEGGGVVGSASLIGKKSGKYRGRLKLEGAPEFIPAPPGAFPGVRTSYLRNSIAFVSPEALATPLKAAYGTRVRYGRFLELGTSRMAARPWIVRSAHMARAEMMHAFVRQSSRTLKKAGLTVEAR